MCRAVVASVAQSSMSCTVRRSNRSPRDSQRVKVTRYRPVPGAPGSRGWSVPSDQTDESPLRRRSARRSTSAASAKRWAASASGAAKSDSASDVGTCGAGCSANDRHLPHVDGGHRCLTCRHGHPLIEQGVATRGRGAVNPLRDADRPCDRRPDCGGDGRNRSTRLNGARCSGIRRRHLRHGQRRGCDPVRVLADAVPTHGLCPLIQGASRVV